MIDAVISEHLVADFCLIKCSFIIGYSGIDALIESGIMQQQSRFD